MHIMALICANYPHMVFIMPADPDLQAKRRAAIVDILRENPVTTQGRLVTALRERGFSATQSSVSRDFRVLGASKSPTGYQLPDHDGTPQQAELIEVASFVQQVQPAGSNLVVLKTATGAAQAVALAIDRSGWPEIVGTVSGDDTIFIASTSAVNSRNIVKRLNYLFNRTSA